MIKDTDGVEITYWPVSGLDVGDSTDALTIVVDTPMTSGMLFAANNPKIKIWARIKGSGNAYQDIAASPISLVNLSAPSTEFEVYLECIGPVVGTQRLTTTIAAATNSPAAWLS